MIRKLRRALPRRTVLLIALAVGLAIFASAGAGADPRPPEPRVAQVDFAAHRRDRHRRRAVPAEGPRRSAAVLISPSTSTVVSV